ncbi:GFA family protein, partial [Xanthomonas citri]
MDTSSEYSGGCQCGAVRFHVRGALADASICHCRMCQKAFGAYYAPLVSVRGTEFRWTRGEPKRFASSTVVQRGFCADCGTPLT